MFAGRQLGDSAVLAQEGVADEDTLHILARLLGGGKKRKKKTYTKPKKQKHKHKKIKLRVLKFFKVRFARCVVHPSCKSTLVYRAARLYGWCDTTCRWGMGLPASLDDCQHPSEGGMFD